MTTLTATTAVSGSLRIICHSAFNHGEYDPESAEGQHVLAHELAHVRQQTGGALSMLPRESGQFEVDPDPEREQEAEQIAQRVVRGSELGHHRLADTAVHVQRLPDDSEGVHPDPLGELKSLGLSQQLLQRVEEEIPEEKHSDFVADVKRVLNSTKSPKDQGDVGEILSLEKGIDVELAADLTGTDVEDLATIPAPDTFTKGFDMSSGSHNPEFDKVIYNKNTMNIVAVLEEKTSGNKSADDAVSQAEKHLATVSDRGYDQIINDSWMEDSVIDSISPSDFEGASVGAIVARGMDDSEDIERVREEQAIEYDWTPTEFEILYKVLGKLKD